MGLLFNVVRDSRCFIAEEENAGYRQGNGIDTRMSSQGFLEESHYAIEVFRTAYLI